MSAQTKPARGSNVPLLGGGILMVLCCAVGPAVIGAVAGSAIGGWLGIACAVILTAVIGLVLHRRTRKRDADVTLAD
jgi:outer membrane lipoprotein SlyB